MQRVLHQVDACLYKEDCRLTLFDLLVTEWETNGVLIALNQIISELESTGDGSLVRLQLFCDDELQKEEVIKETSLSHLHETIQIYAAISLSDDENNNENMDEEYIEKLTKKVLRRLK